MNSGYILRTMALCLLVCAGIAGQTLAADLTLDEEAPVPFTIDWGGQRATATVINLGDTPAGAFVVHLGISHPSSLAATRPQALGVAEIPGMAPGERVEVSIPFSEFKSRGGDPKQLSTGLLDVKIDPDGTVAETNEDNNRFIHVF